MCEITLSDPNIRHRKRINQNPRQSLSMFQRMKAEDIFEFGFTTEDLANRLLAEALANYRKEHHVQKTS